MQSSTLKKKTGKIIFRLILLACLLYYFAGAVAASAETINSPKEQKKLDVNWLRKNISERVSSTFRLVSFYQVRRTRENLLTRGREKTLELDNSRLHFELRPDFFLDAGRLQLSLKPRLSLNWSSWNTGSLAGERHREESFFINEWQARYMMAPELFITYGRENLHWGPSYLISPSNPFIRDRDRLNPLLEGRGADFARILWSPAFSWNISAIANLNEGERTVLGDFKKTCALKIDYTATRYFMSIIPHVTEEHEWGAGYYLGWNATDALILHTEGRTFDQEYEVLTGGSYTFMRGTTITLEYYHNSAGSKADPLILAFPPFGDIDPDSMYFRKNYLLFQVLERNIMDKFHLTLRWKYSLDESTSRTMGILEYELGDHLQLYAVGHHDSGGPWDEFGGIQRYMASVGAQYTF